MAVSNPPNINVAPSYEGVMQELNNRANLELKRPQIGNVAADAINTNTEHQYDMNKILLQHKLNTDMEKMKEDFQSRGDVTITPDIQSKFKEEFGVDLPLATGTRVTADDIKTIQDSVTEGAQKLHSKALQDLLKNPNPDDKKWVGKVAAEWVGSGHSGDAKELIDSISGAGVITKVSPSDGLMHRYNKYSGADLGVDSTTPANANGLNPVEIKAIEPVLKDYSSKTITEKEKLNNITKANTLLNDPNAKGIGQNVALMSTVRDSISSASRMNQIELQKVTGLPDVANSAKRVYQKLVNGDELTPDDRIALKAVLGASANETNQNIKDIEDQYVHQGSVLLPNRSPDFVRSKLTGKPLAVSPASQPAPAASPAPSGGAGMAPQAPPSLPGPQAGAAPLPSTPSGQTPLASQGTGAISSPQEEANAYMSKFRPKPKKGR